jgi:hypothetical protein
LLTGSSRTESLSRERPITSEENAALARYGEKQKQWAVSFGFVNMLLGVFAFVEPAQDFGSGGASVLGAIVFVLGLVAVGMGVVSRRNRSQASKVRSAGMVCENEGVVQSSNLRVMKVGLQGGGVLEVPRAGTAGNLGTDGSRAAVVFSKPSKQRDESKVILISTNSVLLQTPVQCTFTESGTR